MSILEVKKMSLCEKFQIMELIWADLRDHVDALDIPKEHKQILDSRRGRVSSGKASIQDWDQEKHSIGKP